MDSPLPPDPYAALGVSKDAAAATIKATYRKLVLKCHPDKVSDEALKQRSAEEFHKIQQAYEILGDEDKRARYDALVRLAELKRQNMELRGDMPSVSVRTTNVNYDIRTPSGTRDTYSSSRGARFDERRSKYYYDDEYFPKSSSKYADYEYVRRGSGPIPRVDRTRLEREMEERNKAEKRREREAGIRDSRSRKYDDTYSRMEEERRRWEDDERERRKAEEVRRKEPATPTERKYDEDQQSAKRYMDRSEVRPSVFRRQASSAVPQSYSVRRSAASSSTKDRDRDREKEREKERERARAERREKEAAAEAREKLVREKAAQQQRERLMERERDAQAQREALPTRSRRTAERSDSFERRPATLHSYYSSPPVVPDTASYSNQPNRSYTAPSVPSPNMDGGLPPGLNRSSTMPSDMPSSSSTRRNKDNTPVQPSRLRTSDPIVPDHMYPTASPLSTDRSYSSPTQQTSYGRTTERKYDYSHLAGDDYDDHEQAPRSRDQRSPYMSVQSPSTDERGRPSETASKILNSLTTESQRKSTRTSQVKDSSSSSQNLGRASRSPDYSSRRDRTDRREERNHSDDRYVEKGYGERGPGKVRGERSSNYDSYSSSRRYVDDSDYISSSTSRRQREFERPTMHRNPTYVH